jgi:hypothetical protein
MAPTTTNEPETSAVTRPKRRERMASNRIGGTASGIPSCFVKHAAAINTPTKTARQVVAAVLAVV